MSPYTPYCLYEFALHYPKTPNSSFYVQGGRVSISHLPGLLSLQHLLGLLCGHDLLGSLLGSFKGGGSTLGLRIRGFRGQGVVFAAFGCRV